MNRLFATMNMRDWCVLVVMSIIVAACGVFGVSYVLGEGWPVLKLWEEALLTVLFAVLVAIALMFAELACDKCIKINRVRTIFERLTPSWSLRSIAIFCAIMALCWLPWYIANFPGGTYWDTYYQIFQIYPENHPIAVIPWSDAYNRTLTDAWLVDHHPVATTLLYGAFGWISDQLTGDWMAGVAIFCALQGIAHIIAFTGAVAYLRKIGSPPLLSFIAYVFFALMPPISTWAMCMVKDSTFGLIFIPYFLMLIECVRTNGEVFSRRRNRVLMLLLALGLCLTKKTGVFVVVFTAIAAVIVFAKRTKMPGVDVSSVVAGQSSMQIKHIRGVCKHAILAFAEQAIACLLVICFLFPYVIFPLANIEPGGKQEVLGPLFQQTARYIVDYGDEVTPEERESIEAVLDYKKIERDYDFDFEDAVKYRYNIESTADDLKNYFKVYVEQGLKHPDAYFGAFMSLAGLYVAPTSYLNIRMVTVDTKMGEDDRYMLWNPDELDGLRLGLDEAYAAIGQTPVIDLPLLTVTYVLWIPAILLYLLYRNRSRFRQTLVLEADFASESTALPTTSRQILSYSAHQWLHPYILFAPLLVLFAFCIIAPVFDARYTVPLLDVIPLLFCAVFVCIMNLSIIQSHDYYRRSDDHDRE